MRSRSRIASISLAAPVIAAATVGSSIRRGPLGCDVDLVRLGPAAVDADGLGAVGGELVAGHLCVDSVGGGVGEDFEAAGEAVVRALAPALRRSMIALKKSSRAGSTGTSRSNSTGRRSWEVV